MKKKWLMGRLFKVRYIPPLILAFALFWLVLQIVVLMGDRPHTTTATESRDVREAISDCLALGGSALIQTEWNKPAGEPGRLPLAFVITCHPQEDTDE